MKKPFSIRPESIHEGAPITVEVHTPVLKNKETLTVSGKDETFQVPIRSRGGAELAEFSLYRAGNYTLSLNGESATVTVSPHKDLGFGPEFGILGTSVLCALGGLLLWNHRRSRRNAAGSF